MLFDPALDMPMRSTASVGALWQAVTVREFFAEWWPGLHSEPREGARIDADDLPYRKKKRRQAIGRVLEVDEGERILYEWTVEGRKHPTKVEILVSQSKKKSKVRVIESGFDKHDYIAIEVERQRDFWRDRFQDLREYLDKPKHVARLEAAAKAAAAKAAERS